LLCSLILADEEAKRGRAKANRRRRQRPRARPVDVFISYAKQDNGYYTLLYRQLSIVEMNGFRVFASPLIPAGALRHEETKRALATATVALLLVSDNYVTTKPIIRGELPRLLRNAETKGTRILAVVVDYVAFDHVKRLAKFQPFNSPADPLSELPPRRRKKGSTPPNVGSGLAVLRFGESAT